MTTLPALPFPQEHPLDVAPELLTLQAESPISRIRTQAGDEAWLVTRYSEVKRLLADDRLGRSHREPDKASQIYTNSLFNGAMDGFDTEFENHRRFRSLLQPYFSAKRMRALRPRVEALADELLDGLASRAERRADLHAELSLPLPVLVICELLGVPPEGRDLFTGWSTDIADMLDLERSRAALFSLVGYMRELVKERREHLGDDVISGLCGVEGVGDDEAAFLSATLLFAGHETTTVRVDTGVMLLLTHPDQRQALLERPGLLDDAVEEILRHGGHGGGGMIRYARSDLEVAGVRVREGEAVLLDANAANYDEREFDCPRRFDVSRRPNPHLSFGHGVRYCIGAPLARIELRTVFGRLFSRLPGLRLAAPLAGIPKRAALTGGVTELPVTW
ncbi:cytochrome P450 [Nonomuraea sp. NPDC049158]|uniref:cytochrome P450 n=1 Tax=Nonomuraea sp. NPDC049158 TaxID=3155649 RepID=UPI0033E2846B